MDSQRYVHHGVCENLGKLAAQAVYKKRVQIAEGMLEDWDEFWGNASPEYSDCIAHAKTKIETIANGTGSFQVEASADLSFV